MNLDKSIIGADSYDENIVGLGENNQVTKNLFNITEPQRLAGITSNSILDIILDDEGILELLDSNNPLMNYLIYYITKNKRKLLFIIESNVRIVRKVINNNIEIYENSQKNLEVVLAAISLLGENDKVKKNIYNITEIQRLAGITSTSILDIILEDKRVFDFLDNNNQLRDFLRYHIFKNNILLRGIFKGNVGMVKEVINNSFEIYEKSQKS